MRVEGHEDPSLDGIIISSRPILTGGNHPNIDIVLISNVNFMSSQCEDLLCDKIKKLKMMHGLNGLYFKLGIDYTQDICLEFNI